MVVTLLYSKRHNYAWHFEMMGDAAFNQRQGAIVSDDYVVVGTGREDIMRATANIIDAFRNGKAWDNNYIIKKFNIISKEIINITKYGKEKNTNKAINQNKVARR